MTFSIYGLSGYTIKYWDGSTWVTVSGGTVSSNNKVWKKISFAALATSKIRVSAMTAIDSGYDRMTEVEAWGDNAPPPSPVNVAATANGATASVSSSLGSGFPAGSVINGDGKGTNWGSGGGWADATSGTFPDWVEVDFSGSKTINEIDVFTLQDSLSSPSEPTETMTFSTYGVSGFTLFYWDGSAWQPISSGSVTGNNKVWKKISFTALTTTKIKVQCDAAVDNGYSRLTEVEAWGTAASGGGGSTSSDIEWLVTDQLGTPRMVFDKTGSLANTKRHDYLPFGEELIANQGLRSGTLRYINDGVRQQFTQKERDNETGLDFFGARYYGSAQGRFISPDPLLSSGRLENPQTWDHYSYTLNNPLRFVDPTGLFTINVKTDEEMEEVMAAYDKMVAALGKLKVGSKAYKSLERSLKRLGRPGVANGIVVAIGRPANSGAGAETDVNQINKGTVTITFNEKQFAANGVEVNASALAHEGVHADDAFNVFASSKSMADFRTKWRSNDVQYQTEYDAFFAGAGVYQAEGKENETYGFGLYLRPTPPGKAKYLYDHLDLWNPSWRELDQKQIESKQGWNIGQIIEGPVGSGRAELYGFSRPRNFQP